MESLLHLNPTWEQPREGPEYPANDVDDMNQTMFWRWIQDMELPAPWMAASHIPLIEAIVTPIVPTPPSPDAVDLTTDTDSTMDTMDSLTDAIPNVVDSTTDINNQDDVDEVRGRSASIESDRIYCRLRELSGGNSCGHIFTHKEIGAAAFWSHAVEVHGYPGFEVGNHDGKNASVWRLDPNVDRLQCTWAGCTKTGQEYTLASFRRHTLAETIPHILSSSPLAQSAQNNDATRIHRRCPRCKGHHRHDCGGGSVSAAVKRKKASLKASEAVGAEKKKSGKKGKY